MPSASFSASLHYPPIPAGTVLKCRFCQIVGGVISVLLSNLYLHYVLDLWFERVVRGRLRGEARLVRYIDDFVICFQYREDAIRVEAALRRRLEKFSLTLEPDKTRLVEFGRLRNAKRANAAGHARKPCISWE